MKIFSVLGVIEGSEEAEESEKDQVEGSWKLKRRLV